MFGGHGEEAGSLGSSDGGSNSSKARCDSIKHSSVWYVTRARAHSDREALSIGKSFHHRQLLSVSKKASSSVSETEHETMGRSSTSTKASDSMARVEYTCNGTDNV